MRGQIVKADYDHKVGLIFWVRGEDGNKYRLIVQGFKPYFFIKSDDTSKLPADAMKLITGAEGGYRSLYNENLKKIYVRDPGVVPKIRKYFAMHYEADIRFKRRAMIDMGLRSGIEFDPNNLQISYTEVKPISYELHPIKCYIDIEVLSGERFPSTPDYPIVLVTLYDNKYDEYITLVVDNKLLKKKKGKKHTIVHVKSEQQLFVMLEKYFKKVQPDVIIGWNIKFDMDYLFGRAKKLGLSFNIEGTCIFDLLKGYAKLTDRFSNRLKDVVVEEGFAKPEDIVADEWRTNLWTENREEAIEYNKDDVKYIVMIDEKYDIVDFFWGIKNEVGLEDLDVAMAHSVLVDTLVLRKAYSPNPTERRVLPSSGMFEGEGRYKGAIVFQPRQGVYENIAIFDMSRYYPSIIIAFGISPEKKNGILVEVTRELMHLRDKHDKMEKEMLEKYGIDSKEYKVAKNKKTQVKYLLNAVYGYTGFSSGRLYRKHVAETITRLAREGLMFLSRVAEKKLGRKIIYGDTDSIMIQIKNTEEISQLEKILNKALAFWCKKHCVQPLLKIKFERLAKRMLFVEHKQGGGGAKKRYAAWIVREGNKKVDYILVKGFEVIRRDSAKVTRIAQQMCFDLGLRGKKKELLQKIVKLIKDVREGKYSYEDIAIRKTLRKRLSEYKTNTEFVRGCKYAEKYLGVKFYPGDLVKMLYVKKLNGKPATDVVCFLDEAELPEVVLDIDKIVEKTIITKVDRLLKIFGLFIPTASAFKQKTLFEVF